MNPLPSPREPKIPGPPRLPPLEAARWPPDDDDVKIPAPPGLPSYGGDDGNFRRGAFKPIAVIVGLLIAAGAAVFAVLAVKGEVERMPPEKIAEEKNALQLLPTAEQLPKWREWAVRTDVPALQQEALAHLGWERDPAGIDLAIKALAINDHRVRGTAAASLLEYGSPAADAAKAPLMKALAEADASDKPQIAWALATLKESAAFDEVLAEYRQGHLARVQRLDGSPAFDAEVFAGMVPVERLAALANDESESVRQLVATSLSRTGDAKWTDPLIKLVSDKSIDVAREAAVGLGRIANEKAMAPLLEALSRSDIDSRRKFLEALRDGVGGRGLVLALKTVSREKYEREKTQTRVIFDMLKELADPRVGDALAEWVATSNPHPHWKTEAAMRMAEVGDPRAASILAWRMREDPLKLYDKDKDPEYRQDDNERVVGARMLADIASLNPDKRDEILRDAEDSVIFWLEDKPQPHANGLRFLVVAGSKKVLPKLRTWADPQKPLPEPGAKPPVPLEWETVQSALRYYGWTKDPGAWAVLDKQLFRQGKKKYDVTMDGLMQGGLAVYGMTIRALGVGASDGFAQWGDPKAFPLLVRYVDDKENNEQARSAACFAMGWVADDGQMNEIVAKVREYDKADPKVQFLRACYLEALVRKPVPEATAALVDLLKADIGLEIRRQAARAIAVSGVSKSVAPKLEAQLGDNALRSDATLAFMLGGETDMARRALASYNNASVEAIEELKGSYNQTFGYFSDRNYDNGDIARWIANAEACRYVRVHDGLQDWPKAILSRALQGIDFDNGPHSMTRVQLRGRLYADARGDDEKKRTNAILVLKFMKEKGVLMALKSTPGPAQELARQAFFEVMNPKPVLDRLPEPSAKAQGPGAKK